MRLLDRGCATLLLAAVLALAHVAHAARRAHGRPPAQQLPVSNLTSSAARSLLQYGDWLSTTRTVPCAAKIDCYGRLGNQLISAFFALHVAHTLHTSVRLGGGPGCYANLIEEDPLVIPFGTPAACEGELNVNGWHGHPAVDPHDHDIREDFRYLYGAMKWSDNRPTADELVIYLRAGDIFSDRGPDFYLQAPCCFFDKIIRDTSTPPDKVTLVTDLSDANGQNPCTQYLRDKYSGAKVVSDSVGHDFGYLVHASRLVLGGVSTFGQLAAFMSPSLEHLYLFSWSQAHDNNHIIEPIWASMGYFDWPGVTPHHYIVTNFTARLSQAIDILTTFDISNVRRLSGSEYWHEYGNRGVNSINNWLPYTLSLLVPCEANEDATLQKLKTMTLPIEVLPGQFMQRAVPALVFTPGGWDGMLKQFEEPEKYYRLLYSPSAAHPPAKWLAAGELEYCSDHLQLAYVLQALTTNPFRTSHFLWLSHSSHLEAIAKQLPNVVKRQHHDIVFFVRPAPAREGGEELTAVLLPSALFTPPVLKHEWVARANHGGMSWLNWLAYMKAEAPHQFVHLHPEK